MSAAAVYKWEADKAEPDLAKLRAIAEATGKPLSHFTGGDEASPSAVTIAGVPVSGPTAKLAGIVAALNVDKSSAERTEDDLRRDPVLVERRRPNERHTGLHKMLDIAEAGQFEARFGAPLHPADEITLRTLGRSGVPVATLDDAVEVWLRYRGERLGRAPDTAGPEPGVALLLADTALVRGMAITDEEHDTLRRARCGGQVQTLQGALLLLSAIRAGVEATRARPRTICQHMPATWWSGCGGRLRRGWTCPTALMPWRWRCG